MCIIVPVVLHNKDMKRVQAYVDKIPLLRLRDSVCSLIFIRRIATYFLSRGKS